MMHWFTRNVADTDEGTHADLSPMPLPEPPAVAFEHVAAAVDSLPRWRIETSEADAFTIRATRRTAVLRFVDDVTVRLSPNGGGSRVHARSKSRLGKGDLGQNRRNILELFRAIHERFGGR